MRQYVACFGGSSRINRYISFIDVLNDAVFVDDKCGSIAETLFFIKNSVVFNDSTLEITQQWECDTDVLRETSVGRNAVDADAENLSIGSFEFGDISLIRLQFFRSTTGKSQHIEGEYDVLLPLKVAELIPY